MIISNRVSLAVLCCFMVMSLVISGCTSSGGSTNAPEAGSEVSADTEGYAGTYTNVDDAATTFVLTANGKFRHSTGSGEFSGTYTFDNGELKFCAADKDGSTSCIYAPVAADGSFTYGLNTFRK